MAASLNRRRFLDSLLGTAFASTIVAVVYPVWRYLIPPQSGEPATQSVVAAQASQVKANSGMIFKFGTKPGLLVRAPDGTLHAYNAVCTHLDCTVQFKDDTSQLWCACHNGTYDLGGNVVSGPPPRGLEQFTVNMRGEGDDAEIVVSRG